MREVARLRSRTKLSRRRFSARIGQCSFFSERHGEREREHGSGVSVAWSKTFCLSGGISTYVMYDVADDQQCGDEMTSHGTLRIQPTYRTGEAAAKKRLLAIRTPPAVGLY